MNVVYTILENGIAVAAVEMLKVQDVIPDNGNQYIRYLKMGAIWTGADEALTAFRDKSASNVLNGNYLAVVDEVFLNSLLVLGSEKLGVVDAVVNLTDQLPFGSQANAVVATGAVKIGSRMAIEYIPLDTVPYLRYLKHITGLLQ